MKKVDARAVSPLRLPRLMPVAIGLAALAVGLLLVSSHGPSVQASPTSPLEHIKNEANFLEDTMLEDLRELLDEQSDEDQPELEKLVEKLEELVKELGDSGVDEREALAKLSEMQLAISAMQAQFDLEAIDAHMKSIGEALQHSKATRATSQALTQGDYNKAAKELEQLDPDKVSRQEAKGLGEKLKKLAESFGEAGQQQLSQATSEMAEGFQECDGQQCKGGASKLAGLCKKQGLRKKIGECLGCQLGRLGECKGNCRGGAQCNKNGGTGTAQSDRPRNNWGLGVTGQALGDKATDLEGGRNRFNIAGQHGEGPSEKEKFNSPEAREQARRGYREAYQEYRKMAEAVTEGEALPLGHRQIIRRYFEAIRPDNEEAEVSAETSP